MFCAGCAKPDDRTVVQFASWGSRSEVEIIKPVLAEFEAQNPDIKVDFMHIAQNYFQKIHLLFASNTAPDVIFINNLYLPVYANAGVLSPLSPREGRSIPRDGVRGQFYPQALDALTWQGELYAIPRDVSNMVIYYNKDLFDRKHVPYPRDGWTFEEFLQTAQKLTDRPQTFGVSFEEAAIYWLPFVMSSGETFPSPLAGEGLGVGGINFYADLRKKHHVAPMKNESASATMAQMFLQGRLGMHLSGRWLVPKYREEADFNWDVAPFPRGKAGSIVPADASGWAIAKSTKHPQKAMRLVEFLSSYDSIAKFTESGLIVPARIDAANSKYFLDNKPPHNAKAFLNAIQTSKPTPVTVNYNEVLDKLKKDLEPLFN
jgi:multiple sugar transport system substrate-binding protein